MDSLLPFMKKFLEARFSLADSVAAYPLLVLLSVVLGQEKSGNFPNSLLVSMTR